MVNPIVDKTTGIAATATSPVPNTNNTDFLNKTDTESFKKSLFVTEVTDYRGMSKTLISRYMIGNLILFCRSFV